MTADLVQPDRIVDAHVHLWDPANAEWYPYLAGRMELAMGDVSGMIRRFDPATHAAESAGWNVEKLVNVAAATGRFSIDETLELDRRASDEVESQGQPAAIVGGLVPGDSAAETIAQLDEQLAAPRFRGVRPMGGAMGLVPDDDVLVALQERGLLFELMAHPHQLVDAARRLESHPDLVVVVEHTGWPRANTGEEKALWLEGITALAGVGANVNCKLSGLAMPLGSVDAAAFAPWLEPAIETFGVDRCLFASNFPVDGNHGTLDQLLTAYATVVSGLDGASRDALFASNAERLYRC